jgi:hypothetical protein
MLTISAAAINPINAVVILVMFNHIKYEPDMNIIGNNNVIIFPITHTFNTVLLNQVFFIFPFS